MKQSLKALFHCTIFFVDFLRYDLALKVILVTVVEAEKCVLLRIGRDDGTKFKQCFAGNRSILIHPAIILGSLSQMTWRSRGRFQFRFELRLTVFH